MPDMSKETTEDLKEQKRIITIIGHAGTILMFSSIIIAMFATLAAILSLLLGGATMLTCHSTNKEIQKELNSREEINSRANSSKEKV